MMPTRPLTILGLAVVSLAARCCGATARAAEVSTTVYVGRHFEVRNHDQPVKYVFTGDQRVAQITGSLSANQRLQRWRLRAGWNSVSLTVTVTNLIGQLNQFANDGPARLVQALYQWQPAVRDYTEVGAGQAVEAGAVLWLRARTNAVVAVTGTYEERPAPSLPPGGGYVPSPGWETWSPTLPVGVTTWKYDSQSRAWRPGFTGDLAPASEVPPAVAPGEAIYVHTTEAIELENPDPARRVLFYHTDHLGSSSAITDAAGHLADEAAFYPFGATRHEEHLRPIEARYGFTQKERDAESGLQYFGHRYLHTGLGQWISPDPLFEKGGGRNPYAYVNRNPLKFHDPDGAEIKITKSLAKDGTHVYEIHLKAVFMDVTGAKFDQQKVAERAKRVVAAIEESFKGEATGRFGDLKGKFRWTTKVDMRVVDHWKKMEKDEHVFRIVQPLRTGARGHAHLGGMLANLGVDIYDSPKSTRTPEETAAHEFGHMASLDHFNSEPNLMQEGRKPGTHNVSFDQFKSIVRAFDGGRLNKRDQTLIDLDTYKARDEAKANENQ